MTFPEEESATSEPAVWSFGPPIATQQAASETGGYRLLSDQPFSGENDPLGFDQLAADLAGLILRARESSPFTLGIEGNWGSGKSSLMTYLNERLKSETAVTTVWFDAWSVEEGQALEGLIKLVLTKIDAGILRKAARNKQLMGWAKLALTVFGGWFGIAGLVDSIWSTLAIDPKARNDLQSVMKDAMNQWIYKDRAIPNGRLLVVFVDDLDRCLPGSVFQVFEAIKVHLNAKGMVFVVGYDRQIVSEAVLTEKQYASVKSEDYVEKIVQMSYRIASPSDNESHRLLGTYIDRSRTAHLFEVDPRLSH